MSGRHHSQFRGRGLNFEELKHYQMGDDIRNLDWKVTLRTGQPHVRLYSEEKDRNVIILVDQGANMFFSSIDTMKSVVAAEVAALISWRVLREGDRIGLLIKNTTELAWSEPMRGQQHALHLLKTLSQSNQSLNVASQDHITFSDSLMTLAKRDLRQSTIIILSDFLTLNEDDISKLKNIQRSNDLLAIRISDPMEHLIPKQGTWVMGDGDFQFSLDRQQQISQVNQHLSATAADNAMKLNHLMARNNLPLVELSTDGHHLSQLKRAIGA
ncbi:MoxR protein [Psychromonas marina]|uniref:MoxR protein n=2 Tax=Psychromonas marina TaxID=88364 RepID=A0ABQ6E1X6_9GAMM|nr:MoxR protein [Psychromonas marina]